MQTKTSTPRMVIAGRASFRMRLIMHLMLSKARKEIFRGIRSSVPGYCSFPFWCWVTYCFRSDRPAALYEVTYSDVAYSAGCRSGFDVRFIHSENSNAAAQSASLSLYPLLSPMGFVTVPQVSLWRLWPLTGSVVYVIDTSPVLRERLVLGLQR